MPVSRRQILSAWTLIAAGAAARPGFALTTDTLSPTARTAYLNACSLREQDFHKQLMADVESSLNGKALSQEQKDAIRASATCPICGCPIFASAAP